MRFVIIERGGQFEAHEKGLPFFIRGPRPSTFVCQASTKDKCRAILLEKQGNMIRKQYKIVEELDL